MRRLWLIIAAFLAVQVAIVCGAANGPFVDEALYAVAGMRVLEGQGLSDGYLAWFNGSPFVWPVIAAIGHRMGGLAGARLMAVLLSTVTLLAVAKTAETLFGPTAAAWATAALAVNGLFMALAHFAVYDVPALTGIAVSMWCLTRFSRSDRERGESKMSTRIIVEAMMLVTWWGLCGRSVGRRSPAPLVRTARSALDRGLGPDRR